MMNQITALLGRAIIPAGSGLFVTGVAAGESALTTWKARIVGLVGIVIIALASSVVKASLMLSLLCFIVFGFTLRQLLYLASGYLKEPAQINKLHRQR